MVGPLWMGGWSEVMNSGTTEYFYLKKNIHKRAKNLTNYRKGGENIRFPYNSICLLNNFPHLIRGSGTTTRHIPSSIYPPQSAHLFNFKSTRSSNGAFQCDWIGRESDTQKSSAVSHLAARAKRTSCHRQAAASKSQRTTRWWIRLSSSNKGWIGWHENILNNSARKGEEEEEGENCQVLVFRFTITFLNSGKTTRDCFTFNTSYYSFLSTFL